MVKIFLVHFVLRLHLERFLLSMLIVYTEEMRIAGYIIKLGKISFRSDKKKIEK